MNQKDLKLARERIITSFKSIGINCGLSKDICIKLENACYEEAIKQCNQDYSNFIYIYSEITGNIAINLNPLSSINKRVPENCRLYNRILNDEIEIDKIPEMESYELNPYATEQIRLILDKKLNSTIDKNYEKIPCKFCHEKTLIGKRKQTRSGDEPADEILECDNCGKIYRR
jgi:DNA-directed RNA polymerase subunit M/transcription elongation factor TFIIS